VGGGRSNVTGRYPSRKMGVTIEFESPAVFELEYDDSVLEY
jgi:putative transposase